MDKDFDFDNIGKRTPYRTPDNFFEETQRKILERTVDEQRKKLRSKAFSTMIDLAEETFNIPVRKKSGTKQ